jgi:hypothetical protein
MTFPHQLLRIIECLLYYLLGRQYIAFVLATFLNNEQTLFCDVALCSPIKATNVSEELTAAIFRVERVIQASKVFYPWC